jgi:Terminase small subunit
VHQTAAASATTVARVVELEFDALAAAELTKVDIAAALEKARAKRAERAELKADWVVEELRKIGFANMADYMKSTTEGDPYRDFFGTDA